MNKLRHHFFAIESRCIADIRRCGRELHLELIVGNCVILILRVKKALVIAKEFTYGSIEGLCEEHSHQYFIVVTYEALTWSDEVVCRFCRLDLEHDWDVAPVDKAQARGRPITFTRLENQMTHRVKRDELAPVFGSGRRTLRGLIHGLHRHLHSIK